MSSYNIFFPNLYPTAISTNFTTEGNSNQNKFNNYNAHQFENLLKKFRKRQKLPPIKEKNNRYNTESSKNLNDINSTEIDLDEEDKKENLESEKYLVKIYESNYLKKIEEINYEFGKKKDENELKPISLKRHKYGFNQFVNTNYSTETCMKDFYNKFQKFRILNRKEPLNKFTPSFAFIKSSNEEKIIPNPLGLIKRSGDEKILQMNNQKISDNYIKVLSNSLLYSHHLNEIDLGGNRITNIGASILFKSLNSNQDLLGKIKILDLSNNKIGNNEIDNFINFLQSPKNNLIHINLYGNNLYDDNIKLICDNIGKYISDKLIYLNIGKNLISDDSIENIVNMIGFCNKLNFFIINHNKISNKGGEKIIKKIRFHYELKVLDLSWNNIGDNLIKEPIYEELVNSDLKHPERNFDNFTINEALKNMKFTFRKNPLIPSDDKQNKNKKDDKKKENTNTNKNLFTEPKKINEPIKNPSSFATELGTYFKEKNLKIIHIDISHNNLSNIDCKFLSNEIKNNHSILGLHVDGNEMEIDSLGFINPLDNNNKKSEYFANSHLYYNMNENYNIRKTNIDTIRNHRNKNNCWICEGWREIEFIFIPKEPIDEPVNHLVKIHLNFDNYKPFGMLCIGGSKYSIVRMCPPGDIYYFFTLDTVPVEEESKENKINDEKIVLNEHRKITYTFDNIYLEELNNIRSRLSYQKRMEKEKAEQNGEEYIEDLTKTSIIYTEPDPNQIITISAKILNKINIKPNFNVLTHDYKSNLKYTEPRPKNIINKFVKPRTPWTFPISIWAYYGYEYEGDSEEYLDKCFEFDFNRCQFNKDFKDEESFNELKKMLRERYRDIIDCYKYYSSFSGFAVWQITQNNLTEFISHCNDLCDKNYVINDVFVTQKVVIGNITDKTDRTKNNNKMLSDNIVRHQFMNLLVKVAKDKYVTVLGQTKNVLEATKIAFEKHWDNAIKGFEYHKWRMERYYNEEVDNFLKAHLPLLDALYMSWSKQKGPRKKDVWMNLDEFNNLVQSFVDINEYPIRDNPIIFNYSIRLQINEIYSDKHCNMYLPEFLEALCRAVDKASPIPIGEKMEDWPKEKRVNQPLINKLENVFPSLIKLITNPDYKALKDKFPLPEKDPNINLYIINYDSPWYQGYIIKPKKKTIRLATMKKTRIESQKIEEEINKDVEEDNNNVNDAVEDVPILKLDDNEEDKKEDNNNVEEETKEKNENNQDEKKEETKEENKEENKEETKEEIKEEIKEETKEENKETNEIIENKNQEEVFLEPEEKDEIPADEK